MDKIGFSDTISTGDHEFSVDTIFDEEKIDIVSNITERETVVNSYHFPLKERLPFQDLESVAKEKHKTILIDWKLLFYIHDKVKRSSHPASLNKLGLIFMSKNLLPEAIECFTLAIVQDENFIEAYINLGKAYIKAEIYAEAIEILDKALEISTEYADLQNFLGIAYMKRNEFEQALDKLEKALEINPQYDLSHFMIGFTYLLSIVMKVDTSEMIPVSLRQKKILGHLQKAMDLNHYFEHSNVRHAMKEIQDENYKRAVYLLDDIEVDLVNGQGDHFDDEFYLRFMFGGKSKDDKVISDYIQVLQNKIDEKPKYPDLHNNLGVAYLIQCRNMFLKAMEQFRFALKINPNFKNAKKNLKLAENEGKGFIILLRALLK
jgi:tetratricopeptide (TPR) repeat protein